MNEAQTEFEYIEPALKEAGWGVVESSKVRKQISYFFGKAYWPWQKGKTIKS